MRREGLILGGIGLVTLIIVIVAAVMLSGPSTQTETAETDKVTDKALLLGPEADRETTGSPSAKVTIVEFGDFQCPACAAAQPIVRQITEEYGDRVYFVFRHFPLPMHQNAPISAQAAHAAGEQGKFWEMYHKLYEDQDGWAEKNNAKEIITGYAEEIGLDMTAFNESLDNNSGKDKIQKDQNDSYQVGVNSTPTFFINGEKFPGVLDYDKFKSLIDERLK